MIEDFSRRTKISKSLYFGFSFSFLRDYGFPCFINSKMTFHKLQCGNSYTVEGMPLHLSISLVNSKSPAKLLLSSMCNKPWKSPLKGLNLADYYLCYLFSYLLVKSFWGQGEWEGMPRKRSIDEGKGSSLVFMHQSTGGRKDSRELPTVWRVTVSPEPPRMGRGWLASSCGQMTGRKSAFLRSDVREIKLEQSNTPPYLNDVFLLFLRQERRLCSTLSSLLPYWDRGWPAGDTY